MCHSIVIFHLLNIVVLISQMNDKNAIKTLFQKSNHHFQLCILKYHDLIASYYNTAIQHFPHYLSLNYYIFITFIIFITIVDVIIQHFPHIISP